MKCVGNLKTVCRIFVIQNTSHEMYSKQICHAITICLFENHVSNSQISEKSKTFVITKAADKRPRLLQKQ